MLLAANDLIKAKPEMVRISTAGEPVQRQKPSASQTKPPPWLLLRELEENTGIIRRFAQGFEDFRYPDLA